MDRLEDINMENWNLVFDNEGNIMINGENIVVQHVHTQSIGYIENTEENRQYLGLENIVLKNSNTSNSSTTSTTTTTEQNDDENDKKIKWSHNVTQLLITERLAKEPDFNKPKHKKIKLWQDIAKNINFVAKSSLTAGECDSKYRNLMKTYKKNKTRQNSTGEGAITWEYFTEFDQILGCKASIAPPRKTLIDTFDDDPVVLHEDTENSNGEDNENLNSSLEIQREQRTKRLRKEKVSKNTISIKEYLYIKNKREVEKEDFKKHKWEEEKVLRKEECNALLKLAEALNKK